MHLNYYDPGKSSEMSSFCQKEPDLKDQGVPPKSGSGKIFSPTETPGIPAGSGVPARYEGGGDPARDADGSKTSEGVNLVLRYIFLGIR